VWAIEHYGVQPDLLVSGKSLGGGLPLAGVTGNAEVMDAPAPGGLGGTFGGNPAACAAACVVLDEVATPEFRARSEGLGAHLRERLEALAERVPQIGEVRGLGPMLALELVQDRESKRPAPELAKATTTGALERGLILLSCGLHGNVVRILVPLVASDDELNRGLEILEEALGGAAG
jgi:4-aminobutyrate aminotransferase / (S)-3-amino-2-methylpropionate transaminase / 5-aminovalerate transaminase